MHFNKKQAESGSNFRLSWVAPYDQLSSNNRFIAIDTIRVDKQSRLTLTKRVKEVLPVEVGDKIAIYEDSANPNNIIWKIQRRNEIVGSLTITKNVMIGSDVGGLGGYLPFATNDRPLLSDSSDTLKQTGKSANIMLIDDDQDVLFTFNAAFSSYSKEYNVEVFADAKEALKRFLEVENNQNKKSDFDFVITDIRMPGLNGIQLYQILKAVDPRLKILFISALDSAHEIISVLPNVKLTDIIKKPIEVNGLIQIIRNLSCDRT